MLRPLFSHLYILRTKYHPYWQALAKLGKQYKLTHEKRENRSMTLDDLKLQIGTTLSTTEKGFKLGELRVLAVLFLLLLAPQGARPQSVLDMRFGDLRLYLMRDLRDPSGPARLIVELSMAYTKRYLGPKAEYVLNIPQSCIFSSDRPIGRPSPSQK